MSNAPETEAYVQVGSWFSKCTACGGNADPMDTHHIKGGPKSAWSKGSRLSENNGCGVKFLGRVDTYVR